MSLIDQALKKTQSSLNQQKAEPVAQSKPIARPVPTPTFRQTPRNPLQQRRLITPRIELPGLNKYYAWSLLGLILLTLGAFVIHTNYASIAKRYVNFYGTIFLDQSASVKPTPALPPPTTMAPVQPLSLDGTMEMDNERVALINGHLYHRGEIIEGYRITQIHYNDVLLQNTVTQQSMTLTPALTQ